MFRNLEGWHIVVLVAVIVLLFGSKKLPDAARGLGRSMRIFKSEMKTMQDDDTTTTATTTTPLPPAEQPTTDSSTSGEDTSTTQRETPPRVDG